MKESVTRTERQASLAANIAFELERQQRPPETAAGVARILEPQLGSTDLLMPEQREGDPDRYRQHVLHVAPGGAFSIVSLVWLPGQTTPVHDHVSWCVVGVHLGEETEDRFTVTMRDSSEVLVQGETHRNPQGSIAWLTPPGDIHRVRNSGVDTAISIHVYGADISKLGSSIRNEYRIPVVQS